VVRSYVAVYLHRGHILAPLDPFVTRLATRIEYRRSAMIVVRGDRSVAVRLETRRRPEHLQTTFVEIAPLLRALGEIVRYDPRARVLDVRSPQGITIVTPTPFNPSVREAPPAPVFTPVPVPTPRPVFTGIPIPRRTPLPVVIPTSEPSAIHHGS